MSYLWARKHGSCLVICAPKLLSLGAVNELKIIIFLLNYLTVLGYNKHFMAQ